MAEFARAGAQGLGDRMLQPRLGGRREAEQMAGRQAIRDRR